MIAVTWKCFAIGVEISIVNFAEESFFLQLDLFSKEFNLEVSLLSLFQFLILIQADFYIKIKTSWF